MKIMGYDHGTNFAGWATMRNGKPIDIGIKDFTQIDMPFVLTEIYTDTFRLLEQEKPDVLVLERPVHFQNANSVIALVGAFTSVTMAALDLNIRIEHLRPTDIKNLTGKGNADKDVVAQEMQMRFGLDYDELAVPVLYKVDSKKGRKGEVKDRLFDPSDALALCCAYNDKLRGAV
ncbi:crossover junction endodeoxyribonuclease RuvC [Paenibacillus agilis]|uniref:Crossover junction endodeoxyribonuclease RuvC n=1 Tax=Paenibacillus agilis TaxID=3020863 RepID=A0A559J419_9BACL|nr:crossover junction endodeoxyribonuclease RuvC [Paenibacillus agilis]